VSKYKRTDRRRALISINTPMKIRFFEGWSVSHEKSAPVDLSQELLSPLRS